MTNPSTNNNNIYAVLIRSAYNQLTVRETVLIPYMNGVSVVTRINTGSQGASNAWSFGMPADTGFEFETVLGSPVALVVTDLDRQRFEQTGRWSDLCQRLVRVGKAQTSATAINTKQLLAQIHNDLVADATCGDVYVGGRYVATVQTTNSLNIQTAPVAQPVVAMATASETTSENILEQLQTRPASDGCVSFRQLRPVPTADEVGIYIERITDGVREVVSYDKARSASRCIALVGDTGVGKTTSARHYAMLRNLPFYQLDCSNGLTLADVEGSIGQDGNGNWGWQDSELVLHIQQPSVVLINETNRMNAKQQAMFFSLLSERVLNVKGNGGKQVRVHPNCLILLDFNDGIGFVGAERFDSAFRNRFDEIIRFNYDRAIESQFIKSESLQRVAWACRNDRASFKTPFSTRLLKRFEEWASDSDLGIDYAIGRACESFADAVERDAVKQLFLVERDNIKRDLGIA